MKTISMHHLSPNPKHARTENKSNHYTIMPMIKIDFKGVILFANEPAMNLLGSIGNKCDSRLPATIFKEHPEILQHNTCTDFQILSGQFVYNFSAVSFDEAGYIGLYGYSIRKITVSKSNAA